MKLHIFRLKLIDPLFFSREDIGGAHCPPYIHATALNHAAAWAMGIPRTDQSYIMTDQDGGRNRPRYRHSFIEPDFYFTPARPEGLVEYMTETAKGDRESWVQVSYGGAKLTLDFLDFDPGFVKRVEHRAIKGAISLKSPSEILKAYRLFSIVPETMMTGYLWTNLEKDSFPKLIRLGSFRGLALLEIGNPLSVRLDAGKRYCDHPIDPLVSKVVRGIPVPMLPYPIIEFPQAENTVEVRIKDRTAFVAVPVRKVEFDAGKFLERLDELRRGFPMIENPANPDQERAKALLHIFRTAISMKLCIQGISGEGRLEQALLQVDSFDTLRLLAKGTPREVPGSQFPRWAEIAKEMIDGCEKSLRGEGKSPKAKDTGDGSSSLIL